MLCGREPSVYDTQQGTHASQLSVYLPQILGPAPTFFRDDVHWIVASSTQLLRWSCARRNGMCRGESDDRDCMHVIRGNLVSSEIPWVGAEIVAHHLRLPQTNQNDEAEQKQLYYCAAQQRTNRELVIFVLQTLGSMQSA